MKVPVAQVLKLHKPASKPEQLGLSSSICLEIIYVKLQAWWRVFYGLDGNDFYIRNDIRIKVTNGV